LDWTATFDRLDAAERVLRSTVKKLTTNAIATKLLAADILSQKRILDGLHDRVKDQSRVLGKITNANVARDAHIKNMGAHLSSIDESIAVGVGRMMAVEDRLASVDEALSTVDTRLASIHEQADTTATTTSSLRTDIGNVCERVIPELRRDITQEINTALARTRSEHAA
jgi:CII-binding regulator of phage lambda lysogenization HflD